MFMFLFTSKSGNEKNLGWGKMSYLHGIQRLSVLQPAVRGLGLGTGLAFPHQRVVDGLLDVLRLLGQMRSS